LIRNIISDTLSTYPSENISIRGSEIISDKFSLVNAMAHKKLTPTQLHSIRTKLKQIAYLLKIWKGHDNVTQVIPVDRSYLQTIEIKLGQWHDYEVAQAFIKKFITSYPDDKHVPVHYAILSISIRNNRASLLSEIIPLLKSLFEVESSNNKN
jgi:CHAD domain-containing protein